MNFTNVLCSANVTVWCAVFSLGIICHYSFENAKGHTVTVNGDWYRVMLETFLHKKLHPSQQDTLWFQQDEATPHTAPTSMQGLSTMFLGTHFSFQGHHLALGQPTCSPDLAVPD